MSYHPLVEFQIHGLPYPRQVQEILSKWSGFIQRPAFAGSAYIRPLSHGQTDSLAGPGFFFNCSISAYLSSSRCLFAGRVVRRFILLCFSSSPRTSRTIFDIRVARLDVSQCKYGICERSAKSTYNCNHILQILPDLCVAASPPPARSPMVVVSVRRIVIVFLASVSTLSLVWQ